MPVYAQHMYACICPIYVCLYMSYICMPVYALYMYACICPIYVCLYMPSICPLYACPLYAPYMYACICQYMPVSCHANYRTAYNYRYPYNYKLMPTSISMWLQAQVPLHLPVSMCLQAQVHTYQSVCGYKYKYPYTYQYMPFISTRIPITTAFRCDIESACRVRMLVYAPPGPLYARGYPRVLVLL